MTGYELLGDGYVMPTPAGAFYAVSSKTGDMARRFVLGLLGHSKSKSLSEESLLELTKAKTGQDALELLYRVQELGWVHGVEEEQEGPEGTLEDVLPSLLSQLSSSGKVLLVDDQGLLLSSHGFSYELAEELSALSADLSALYLRHERLLRNNMTINTSAWGLVNSSGDSQLGCWPIHIGSYQFSLVMTGVPQFNQAAFVNLVWVLSKRYLDFDENSEID